MNKWLLSIFLLLLLAACGNDEHSSGNAEDSGPDIYKEFAQVINGTWVPTDYIHQLEQSQSPKASSGKLKDIAYMEIRPGDINNDTLIVSSNLNGHEGYTFYLLMRRGWGEHSLRTAHHGDDTTDSYELQYHLDNGDTTLSLEHYGSDGKLIGSVSYSRIKGPQSENGLPYGLSYAANQALFAGDYTAIDADGNKTDAVLTEDGLVTGIGDHTTYYVFTDFVGDDETNLDEMLFDEHTRNQKGYIFEISGDTTRLYKAMENDDRTMLVKGPLTYTLIRK